MANTNTKAATSPKTTPAKKTVASKKAPSNKSAHIDLGNESRYKIIQDAAYFMAERNNFAGEPQTFWLEAEAQVSGLLSQ